MIDSETISVLAKRLLGGTRAEDVVEWAAAQLVAGKDTPNLRMLAGSGPPFYWSEIEDSFSLALSELGVAVPKPEETMLRYAQIVAEQLLDGKIDAAQAVHILNHVWIGLDYTRKLVVWSDLDDALYDVFTGNEPYQYPSMTRDNFADVVKAEAKSFLAQTTDIPAP